ncbi:MAG: divalent-cation tolerance protein CutA [Acidobacteria bacterium]|nr:MAG: divalent-cation tolerance protein CutA [Acidobacteriota bacterium]
MNDAVVALTTVDAGFDAVGLARTLVERGLASCVNVLPGVTSVYRWEGKIQADPEQQLVIKTTGDRVAALQAAIEELHPYDVPEFIVLPITAVSEDYLKFLKELD